MKKILLICTSFILISEIQSEIIPPRTLSCWLGKSGLKHQVFEVEFYLSTRLKRDHIFRSFADLEKVNFDPQRRTVLVVHGLASSSNDLIIRNLKDKLLDWNDVNVIVVNWEQGCSNAFQYHYAVVNTEYTAWKIQNFYFNLFNYSENHKNMSREHWGQLHFIGLSLGAHVVGQSAELLKLKNNVLVDRVTGLDPAEPCFEDDGMPLRLNQTNARFVDVIHTDGARQRNSALGLLTPLGHVDFYVNGGSVQPGCEKMHRSKRSLNFMSLLIHTLKDAGCQHVRSIKLFTESLTQTITNQCKFWAHPWRLGTSFTETNRILENQCDANQCVEMGINAELYNYEKGKQFYVSTTGMSPFCNV